MRYNERSQKASEAAWKIVDMMLEDGLEWPTINDRYLQYARSSNAAAAHTTRRGLPVARRTRVHNYLNDRLKTPAPARPKEIPPQAIQQNAPGKPTDNPTNILTSVAWPERFTPARKYPTEAMVRVVRFVDALNTFAALLFLLDDEHINILCDQLILRASSEDSATQAFYEAAITYALAQNSGDQSNG